MTLDKRPYSELPTNQWEKKTDQLIRDHPLNTSEIVEVTLQAWNSILSSAIGTKPFQIGKEIFPKPQVMGFFLHELIPLEFATRYPKFWHGEKQASDKDLVYIPNSFYSVEIKTSSHPTQIFGNRSYAQKSSSRRKSKSGYYLAVNFEKFGKSITKPHIKRIRFGWLDHDDWTGQRASTGQQARLSPDVDRYKLKVLFAE